MLPAPLTLSRDHARRFHRRAVLLDARVPGLSAALDHLGYIQIDPINVCGRMHDLVLRERVSGYQEGGLHRYLHAPERPGFEHYLPGTTSVLVAYPSAAWPYLSARIHARRLRGGRFSRKLAPGHERVASHILSELAARGPLTSDEIEHEGRSRTGWGTQGRLVKNLLEILHVHGRVHITARRNFRRVYDLPERVLPAFLLSAPAKTDAETARWLVLLRLRQRRLVLLTRSDLSLVSDAVQEVRIVDGPALYCLREDLPLLHLTEVPEVKQDTTPRLLAPLDPLIYDRRVTSRLWDYDYTWEVYTPPAKRQRGYYALPLLAGTELVGHVDPKADRTVGRLRVMGRSIRRGHKSAEAVKGLAHFLGLHV